MKCYPFEEKRLNKWTPPFIVQPKYDGVRCRALRLPNDRGYVLLSSEENFIFSVPHINESLDRHSFHEELDGELYCHGMKFEEILSITSRSVNLHSNYKAIKFHIFDYIDIQPQMERTIYIEQYRGIDEAIEIAPFWLCDNLEDIMKTYDIILNMNYEGIIVRNILAPYERKRSTWVMKFKPKQDDVYKIVGFQEEVDKNGIPKGRLGALRCESGDGSTFNVGTGFSDDEREALWDIRGTLPGMSARVEYQHISSGRKVPRFPVYVKLEA
jgi:DNA ligase-1